MRASIILTSAFMILATHGAAVSDDAYISDYANKAHAMIGCAELANYAEMPTAHRLRQKGFDLAITYYSYAQANPRTPVPVAFDQSQNQAFYVGRIYYAWTLELEGQLQQLQEVEAPMQFGAEAEAQYVRWKSERRAVAQNEYERRNCDVLVPGN